MTRFSRYWQHLRGHSAPVSVIHEARASILTQASELTAIDMLVQRGAAHIAQQQYQDAEHCIATLDQMNAGAHADYLRARMTLAQGRESEAVALFEAILNKDPSYGAAYAETGVLALRYDDVDEAEYLLSQAVHYQPSNTRARAALAELFMSQRRLDAAREQLLAAIAILPDDVNLHQRLINVYWELGDLPAVAATYKQAVQIAPENFELHLRLANCWREIGELNAARHSIERALELQPGHCTATLSYAHVLLLSGDSHSALARVQALLTVHPGDVLVHWTLALLLLKEGRYSEAWPHHEIGLPHRLQGNRFGASRQLWRGESLAGKRVLIYGEQGLGDEIMFASCFPDVLRTASSCVIECAPKLEKLFAHSFPEAVIHAGHAQEGRDWLDQMKPVDYEIPSGTLPSVVRHAPGDFPRVPVLRVANEARETWRRRLAALGTGLKVGISWRGGTKTTGIYARSIPLEQWQPILATPGVDFINLQYTDCEAEVQAVMQSTGVNITTWQDALDDYYETAALVAELDCVITVCTSIVFVASGLGRPVWVMAPPGASWRYVRGQRHTPWAPMAEVFWQKDMVWKPTIQRVADELAQTVQQSAQSK